MPFSGGSEDKEPDEDQHKEGDAPGSKNGQASEKDGNHTVDFTTEVGIQDKICIATLK